MSEKLGLNAWNTPQQGETRNQSNMVRVKNILFWSSRAAPFQSQYPMLSVDPVLPIYR